MNKEKEIVVYAYVVADLLHIGHIIFLERARKYGNKLIVGILTDKAVMEKKPKPILLFDERIRLVKSLKCVDLVIVQETYSPISNIKKLRPDILMESDNHLKEDLEETTQAANKVGCEVIITPYYSKQSSSEIKDKVVKYWKKNHVN